jgi:hypothetical protein
MDSTLTEKTNTGPITDRKPDHGIVRFKFA